MKFASLTRWIHNYEIRPRADKHGFNLSSDSLRYSPLWYRGLNPIVDAVRYARSYSGRHPVVVRVYDPTGNVIETLEYLGRVGTLIAQLQRTFDNRAHWFEKVRSRLIAEIVADLPRFSEGINRPCFSHYGRFGKVQVRYRHDSFGPLGASPQWQGAS